MTMAIDSYSSVKPRKKTVEKLKENAWWNEKGEEVDPEESNVVLHEGKIDKVHKTWV